MDFRKIGAAFMVLASISITSEAFDTRTHVWVAQQVINDLDRAGDKEDTVTIEPFGEFLVDPVIAHAIRNNPDVYRAGALGPDAFPDIVGGQVTTHPGVDVLLGGWQTDDWLKHVLSSMEQRMDYANLQDVMAGNPDALLAEEESTKSEYESKFFDLYTEADQKADSAAEGFKEIALSYGYLSHAAGDYFAHTYINWYAGDAFELTDDDGLDVELRHMVLEKFIATKQPPLLDVNGNNVGKPHESIYVDEALPVDYIVDTLLQNDDAANQYDLSGSAPHLVYMHQMIENLKDARKELDDIKRNIVSQFIDEIVTEAADAAIAVYTTPYIETAEQAIDACESLGDLLGEDMRIQKQNQLIAARTNNFDLMNENILLRAAWYDDVGDAIGDGIDDTSDNIGDAVDDTSDNVGDVIDDTSDNIGDLLSDTTENLGHAVTTIVAAGADVTQGLIDALDDPCALASDPLEQLIVEVEKASDNLSDFAGDLASLKLIINSIDAVLGNWQHDLKAANREYILMSSRIGREVMDKESGDALAEMSEFLSCQAPAYVAIPSTLTTTGCFASDVLADLDNEITKIIDGIFPIKAKIDKIKDKIKDKIVGEIGKQIVAALEAEDELELLKLATEDGSDENLINAFALTGGPAKLLPIPDIVGRASADMNLDSNGYFQASKFVPVANAIVLAKLSLLDDTQLNILVARAGVQHTAYNDQYLFNDYGSDRYSSFNILFGGVRSIDGNFAWMPIAPHWPRQNGFKEESLDEERSFGYENNGLDGFRLWLDPEAREKIFKKIFMGPITPGIEYPASVGFNEIIPSDYKDRICAANPFPLDSSYQRCGSVANWLIPILSLIQ